MQARPDRYIEQLNFVGNDQAQQGTLTMSSIRSESPQSFAMMRSDLCEHNYRADKTTLAPKLAFAPTSMQGQRRVSVERNGFTVHPLPTNAQFQYVRCHCFCHPYHIARGSVLSVRYMNTVISDYDQLPEREEMAVPSMSYDQARAALGNPTNGTADSSQQA